MSRLSFTSNTFEEMFDFYTWCVQNYSKPNADDLQIVEVKNGFKKKGNERS